jgi:hypothetical protein
MPNYTWLRPSTSDSELMSIMKLRSAKDLKTLKLELSQHIAAAEVSEKAEDRYESSRFVRIATWNLREFDSPSYGYRTDEAKAYIAEILSHFDLIALQEIRRDLHALDSLKWFLGPEWDYVATDVTEGEPGNEERMAFVFNTNKVKFQKVAGELTLPRGMKVTDPFGDRFRVEGGAKLELPNHQMIVSPGGLSLDTLASGEKKLKNDIEIPLPDGVRLVLPSGSSIRFAKNARVPINAKNDIDIPQTPLLTLPEAAEIVLPPNSLVGGPQQFARTPFIAAFQAGWLRINLATVHIYYGEGTAGLKQRKDEIGRLTTMLAERASNDRDSDADSYFIVLGDFNITHPEQGMMEALTSNNFHIPEPLTKIPGTNVKKDKHYDQIALWEGKSKQRGMYTRIIPYRAGVFDYFNYVFREVDKDIYTPLMVKQGSDGEYYNDYKSWRTYQMSDHLPMWLELRIDFAAEYLDYAEARLQTKLNG